MHVTARMKLTSSTVYKNVGYKDHREHGFNCKKRDETNPQKQKADWKLPRGEPKESWGDCL